LPAGLCLDPLRELTHPLAGSGGGNPRTGKRQKEKEVKGKEKNMRGWYMAIAVSK